MRAGKLDRRLTIRRASMSHDGFANVQGDPSDLATVWAERMPMSDGERNQQGGVFASATVRFRVRYSATVADLNPKDTLTCEGRGYEVLGVKEIGRREGLEITASERTDD